MKNYKDMAEAVFRRRDEYVAEVRRKKKVALNASLSLCAVCLAVLGAFGIWKTGILEPDPNVIGTKPHSFTETTDVTMQSLSGNAASEGKTTENTEAVSGNSVTTPEGTKNPQASVVATDPQEKPDNPTVKPTIPAIKPTIPLLPTLPIGPNLPSFPSVAPDVPPTSGDYPKPKPPVVLPTDPVEPEATDATSENEPATDITWVPSYSPVPTTAGSDHAGSDAVPDSTQVPTENEPGYPGRPDEVPDLEEPTEPTESPVPPTEGVTPDIPLTSVEVNRVEGKVLDQYGNPVKGAVVKVYYDGEVDGTRTTDSNGYFYISKFRAPATIKVYSVPDGYTLSGLSCSISKGNSNVVLICNKK
ncbi:MAG: carboxypeptidase regulatory-like domain-containing protein [Clostridia bacterium]|nr:carboxypeptidase regulatory-like domain-containing protein [Clostridia bacterium]